MKCVLNGKKVEIERKKTVLEAARENGIFIPTLCDLPRLSPFSGCRMCLVEIEGRRGYIPSCSTYVEDEMVIVTDSLQLKKMRRQILELILSEHPSSCLICSEKESCDDKKATIRKVGETTGCVLCPNNGRCELQDVVKTLGMDRIGFPALYRDLEVRKDDPFFDRNYNLCILCGRCVRVCHEIRGASAISFVQRGSREVIGTAFDRPLSDTGCQFCGACVDVCPTGSLTERSIKYEALPDAKRRIICPLCGVGCALDVEVGKGKILSSRPSADSPVNKGQGCVKGRFVIKDAVHTSQRLISPKIRKDGQFEEVEWDEALDFVARKLKTFRGEEVALVDSPHLSLEDLYTGRKFAGDVLKTQNVASSPDSALSSVHPGLAGQPSYRHSLNFRMKDFAEAKTIVLIGADLASTHPIVWLEALQAIRNGSSLIVISPLESPLVRHATCWLRNKPGTEIFVLGYMTKILSQEEGFHPPAGENQDWEAFSKSLRALPLDRAGSVTGLDETELREASLQLAGEGSVLFLAGSDFAAGPHGKEKARLLQNLALMTSGNFHPLGLQNNQRGLFELNETAGHATMQLHSLLGSLCTGQIKALYLCGEFPWTESNKAEFTVFQGAYACQAARMADAVLPAAIFAETQGTFINIEGRIQTFDAVIDPIGEAKPDWWILSQLARRLKTEGFAYKNATDIAKEIIKNVPAFRAINWKDLSAGKEIFVDETVQNQAKLVPVEFPLSVAEPTKKYPLLMVDSGNPDVYRNLSLSDISGGLKKLRDPEWIFISLEDAHEAGVANGETLEVLTEWGRFSGSAKVVPGIPPGILRANFSRRLLPKAYAAGSDSSRSSGIESMPVLPVKIKRGK